jgi:hypothetical protein
MDSVPRSVLIMLSLSRCAVVVHAQSADMPGAVAEVNSCCRIVSLVVSRRGRSSPSSALSQELHPEQLPVSNRGSLGRSRQAGVSAHPRLLRAREVVPMSPGVRIGRQRHTGNISQRLEHPPTGLRVQGKVAGEVEQSGHSGAALRLSQHAGLRQAASRTLENGRGRVIQLCSD